MINEQRALTDKALLNVRRHVTNSLSSMENTLENLQLERLQLKAMVKNQNFHFTEIQKTLGVTVHRTDKLERFVSVIPSIQEQIDNTDKFLNFYQPMEIATHIHNALKNALESAPTKIRLD